MNRRRAWVSTGLLLAALLLLARTFRSGREAPGFGDGPVATLEMEARFPDAFSYLGSAPELSSGEVLVADPGSQVVVRADLRQGKADTLGGVGSGPQEYRGPDKVFALPGDSALLVDLGNGRLTVIAPSGTFVGQVPMAQRTPEGRVDILTPDFVDQAGKLYAPSMIRSADAPSDSTPIARYSRTGSEEAVVAWAWHPDHASLRSGKGQPILTRTDVWAVAGDGRVAVVRANGFSVDWYEPDGTVIRGPSHEVETFPVGASERDAEIAFMMEEAIVTEAEGESGEVQRFRRGLPSSMASRIQFAWPDHLPVFRSARVSPEGNLWVERIMPRSRPPRYDVFDSSGRRLGHVEFPANSRLLGFGRAERGNPVAYVARTDEVGLKWLERYRVVPTGERSPGR